MSLKKLLVLASLLTVLSVSLSADARDSYSEHDKTLQVISTAHLDTQWLWTIQKTITDYIPATLHGQFHLIEKYPDYMFSFEGAFRYMLMKEYYPKEYAQLKEYIAANRWAVCGSSIESGDVNTPSAEAIIRNIMYGNRYFMEEFGKKSSDIFLPDCFGFGYTLPTIATHCGLLGFSSQKLTWGSSVGTPFDIGMWEGVDGSRILAELGPGRYVTKTMEDLSESEEWIKTVENQGKESGLYVGYRYFGVGDRGGAPKDEFVDILVQSIHGKGPLKVACFPADSLCRELTVEQKNRLPHYKGELLMTKHGVGCYTAQGAMKRWNRMNELLADSAERASVMADWLGAANYPREKLREAWIRFIWHQFHDDLTGTSLPEVYPYSWNDEVISLNQLSAVLEDASGAVSRTLDTQGRGEALVVYNPLATRRSDVVEAEVVFPDGAPSHVRVYDPDGNEVASQVGSVSGNTVSLLFLAEAAPVSYTVFDVVASDSGYDQDRGLSVSRSSLENSRYRVDVDSNGTVTGIYDKLNRREVIAKPLSLDLLPHNSIKWPAWELLYEDVSAEPIDLPAENVTVKVVADGPVRAALEVSYKRGQSTYTQCISLDAGDAGDMLVFDTEIDWRTTCRTLKATFPFAVSNQNATYDLGIGTIDRGTNTEQLFEVPSLKWADLSDADGSYGVTVMNDSRYGWDKPNDSTLRLTLLHTPLGRDKYGDQRMLDIGRHQLKYAISGHKGDWRESAAYHEAARFNQPLTAYQAPSHTGDRGKSITFLDISTDKARVMAVKYAEDSDEIVIRVVESDGRAQSGVAVSFIAPVVEAREINGAEEPVGPADVADGSLVFDLKPYQPRTFAIKLELPSVSSVPPSSMAVALPYNIDVVSSNGNRCDGAFDDSGISFSAELFPKRIECEGVGFDLGPDAGGEMNAVECRGQTIELPRGRFNKLYILASASEDTEGTFTLDNESHVIPVQCFNGHIGQWDSRMVNGERTDDIFGLAPAFIKRDKLAWVGTHTHGADNTDKLYEFSYIYRYSIDLAGGARTLTLPNNPSIKIFAVSAGLNWNDDVRSAQLLYD